MAQILLVDDNPSVRELFQAVLENTGHDVVNASNGKEALDIFSSSDFDLVITDLLMPEMTGTEFICELKARIPELPIIAVSGNEPDPTDPVLSFILTSETIEHLKKPFRPDHLTSLVERLLH